MKQPELGKRIAELRQSQGLTQEELVEQCNINVRTIQRIEAGEVTPRNYTVKAIFDVLGSTWDDLKGTPDSVTVDLNKQWLLFALVSSILYLFTGIPEAVMDYARISDDFLSSGYYDISDASQGSTFYVLIKVLAGLSYAVFISGFFHVADKLKLSILKVGALTLGLLTILFMLFDILSIWIDSWNYSSPTILVIYLMLMGAGASIFGLGLFSLRSTQGDLAAVVGILEIVTALCLFTFVLSFLAIFIAFPMLILEAVLLYRMYTKATQS